MCILSISLSKLYMIWMKSDKMKVLYMVLAQVVA